MDDDGSRIYILTELDEGFLIRESFFCVWDRGLKRGDEPR